MAGLGLGNIGGGGDPKTGGVGGGVGNTGGGKPTPGAGDPPAQATTRQHDGEGGKSGPSPNSGRGNSNDAHLNAPGQVKKLARAQEQIVQGQQTKEQLKSQLEASGSVRVNNPATLDNPSTARPQNTLPDPSQLVREGNPLPDTHRLGEQPSAHTPQGNAYGWHRRFDNPSSESTGAQTHFSPNRGQGSLHSTSASALGKAQGELHGLTTAAEQFLRGRPAGENLSQGLQRALTNARSVLGQELAATLKTAAQSEGKATRIIQHALAHLNHEFEKAAEKGNQSLRPTNDPGRMAKEFIRAAVEELAETARLERFFRQMEKRGGQAVTQAEERLARLLYGERGGDTGQLDQRQQRIHPAEVLRDLRTGAFLPAEESYNPFPLTGRARVVTEFMELMRTLELIDRAEESLANLRGERAATMPGAGQGVAVEGEMMEALISALMEGRADGETLESLLASLVPSLPGRAGRVEMLRLVAAFEGLLADAHGHGLVGKDGVALKLDQLLWVGALGGALRGSFNGEQFPVHLSPLLIYGFDAIYSVIGFDGRTLNPPHFAAVQAHLNGSEMEWAFGQPPLTQGWMRALIERLKDSLSTDDNLLGELLEVALSDGCFHAVLMSGRVDEGEPVSDSFSVVRLLPGFSADLGDASAPA